MARRVVLNRRPERFAGRHEVDGNLGDESLEPLGAFLHSPFLRHVVAKDDKVVSRPVRLGALHDGLREVTDGLLPGERLIVNCLQQVRPGATVELNIVDMPQRGQKSEVRGQKSERTSDL